MDCLVGTNICLHILSLEINFQSTDLISVNKNFETEIIRKKPKVLILGTADNYREFLLPQTIRNIRENGIKVIGILGDDEFNYPQYRFLLGWFDLFVAYVKPCLSIMKISICLKVIISNSCYLQ